ncbi:MAG: enoyl-CoA hydratase/isomerase family protein [Nocardioides sp.]|jgi:enoyl-CoA hydratase/carnithine racemase
MPTHEELTTAGLDFVQDGPVATITLDRPDVRNAQTPLMWETLAALGSDLGDEVRIVIVKGNGHSFSAGLDRAMLDPKAGPDSVIGLLQRTDEEMSAQIGHWQEAFTFLRDPRFVSIAQVHGFAIGAGFQLALSCDLRVVADDAIFCMKESALGLVPDLTGTKPLVDAVGYARALEICATARNISGDEAGRLGLATTVVAADQLDAATAELVRNLTAPLPGAVRETKAILQQAAARDLDSQRRVEREAQVRRFRELAELMKG